MTTQVNVQEAKTHLSRLLARAVAGEDIVIARDGQPLVRLTAVGEPPERELGFVDVKIPESFWAPLPDGELEAWS